MNFVGTRGTCIILSTRPKFKHLYSRRYHGYTEVIKYHQSSINQINQMTFAQYTIKQHVVLLKGLGQDLGFLPLPF